MQRQCRRQLSKSSPFQQFQPLLQISSKAICQRYLTSRVKIDSDTQVHITSPAAQRGGYPTSPHFHVASCITVKPHLWSLYEPRDLSNTHLMPSDSCRVTRLGTPHGAFGEAFRQICDSSKELGEHRGRGGVLLGRGVKDGVGAGEKLVREGTMGSWGSWERDGMSPEIPL